jgi:glycine cleavage system H protein
MLKYFSTSTLNLTKRNLFQFVLSKNFSKYFAKSHEWIQVEKGVATVGISNFAQSELGEIVHVDFPKVGDKFKAGDTMCAVESVKTAADIYAPVEGVIGEVNDKLSKTPSLLNEQPLSQGWILKLKVDEAKIQTDLQKLMNEDQYDKFLADSKK